MESTGLQPQPGQKPIYGPFSTTQNPTVYFKTPITLEEFELMAPNLPYKTGSGGGGSEPIEDANGMVTGYNSWAYTHDIVGYKDPGDK